MDWKDIIPLIMSLISSKLLKNVCFVCPRAMLSLLSICLQVLQIIRHLVFNYRKIIVSAVSGWSDGW